MAKYFLGSVGSVEAFERKEDGSYELAFVSKTLTDSGINTTISKEDIRGGTGAPIQFSFYHDPAVEITLTEKGKGYIRSVKEFRRNLLFRLCLSAALAVFSFVIGLILKAVF